VKQNKASFKWRHFEPTVILLCGRRCCRYRLSYRGLQGVRRERGLSADRTTIFRRVQKHAPGMNKRMRPRLRLAGASYRGDETYVEVGRQWEYLCRAPDKEGNTIEFMLSAKRDVPAVKRFFKKMTRADRRRLPFSISVDKHASCPDAFAVSQEEKVLPFDCRLRRAKYSDNIVEQDHRFVRRRRRATQCFRSSHTAERTLGGVEATHTISKGQVKRLDGRDAIGQATFAKGLFGVAAWWRPTLSPLAPQ
jgi:IS6 family transposase